MSEPLHKRDQQRGLRPSALIVAGQFLTIMPPLIKRPFRDDELGAAVGFFPIVGLILGLILLAADALLTLIFPPAVRAALLLALWVILSGALHLDGLLDSCDGLFGGFTPEKRLHIMRDERVGAYALAGGSLLLLAKFAALSNTPNLTAALLLAPALGRWAISLAVIGYPYARRQGLGRAMKDNAGGRELLLATVVAVAAALLIGQGPGVIALLLAVLIVRGGTRFVLARLPGLTGDIYGSLCELAELAVLLVFAAMVLW